MAYVLGIDLGTTSLQGVLVDPDGRQHASAERSYPLFTPRPGWSEQEPAGWYRALCEVSRELLAAAEGQELLGVALAGQMHGLVAVNGAGEPVHNAILWNDQRTAAQAAQLSGAVGEAELIRLTGNPAVTGFQLPKLLWLRDHEPGAFARTEQVLLPKDWLAFRLTGNFATEPSDAAGTGCFDLQRGDWAEGILEAVGIDRSLFPPVHASHDQVGTVHAEAAAATGLPAGTPVFAGAGDNAAANIGLGLGSHRPDRGSLSLGTSGVVFMPHLKPEPDPQGRVHLFAHADQGWCLLGVTLAAGGSIAWFRDRFLPGQDFGELNRLAAAAPAGSGGVSFHPYLAGERSPWLDPGLRGSFTGLSLASGLPELARAVLEGVAFSLRDVLDVFREQLEVSQLLVTGGGASSELLLQIAASALEVELQVVAGGTGAAYGSALLALQGLKLTDAAASAARVSLSSRMTPQPDAQLEDMRQRYVAVRRQLHQSGS